MKKFTTLLLVAIISITAMSQTPKNIVYVIADGVGFNHANIVTSNKNCILNKFNTHYAVSNYPTYWGKLTDEPRDIQNYRGDYHVRRVWQEFSYANNMPMSPITAGTALATGSKSAYQAVSDTYDNAGTVTLLEEAKNGKGKATALVSSGDITKNSALISFAAHAKAVNNDADVKNLFYNEIVGRTDADIILSTSNITSLDVRDVFMGLENVPEETLYPTFYVENTEKDFSKIVKPVLDRLLKSENGFFYVSEFVQADIASRNQDVSATVQAMKDFEAYISELYAWIETNSSWDETLLVIVGAYERGYLTSKSFDQAKPVENYLSKGANDLKFNSDSTTNLLTPMWAKGAGENLFKHYTDETDYLLGSYVNNSEIAQAMFRLLKKPYQKPKNIILMINDGCGIAPIMATEFYTGTEAPFRYFPTQLWNCTHATLSGNNASMLSNWDNSYESRLAWTDKKYLDKRNNATCSGASATAIASGKKTYYYSLGVDVHKNAMNTIAQYARKMGKSVGVATNSPFTDATPAAFFANNPDRKDWNSIARQLVIESDANVIIGCHHPEFDKNAQPLAKPDYTEFGGKEMIDGLRAGATEFAVSTLAGCTTVRDIDNDGTPDPWTFVESKESLLNIMNAKTTPKRVFGVMPVQSTMQFYRTGINDQEVHHDDWNENMPQLWEIGLTAIHCMENNENGFFLMFEGDMVDNAGHFSKPGRLIEEQMEFNLAVEKVVEWVENNSNWGETLLIVTADHETGFITDTEFADDPILLNHWEVKDNGIGNMPGLMFNAGDHSNQLVPFFAYGAGADIFYKYADEWDYVRGRYLNNSEIGQALYELWDGVACDVKNHAPQYVLDTVFMIQTETDFEINIPKDIVFDADGDEIEIEAYSVPSWVTLDLENFTMSGTAPLKAFSTRVMCKMIDKAQNGAAISVTFSIQLQTYKKEELPIDEVQLNNQVYPIPALHQITVETFSNDGVISIRNMQGKLIRSQEISGNKTDVNVSDLPSGEYLLQIIEGENVTNKKIIVR